MIRRKPVQLVADPYPPYQFLENSRVIGIDHDIIQAAFAEHGIEICTRLFTWDQCIKMLEERQTEGLFQVQPTAQRKRTFLFSALLRTAESVFLKKSNASINLSKLATDGSIIEKFSLATVKGYSYNPTIDKISKENRIFVENQEDLLIGLSLGNFDLALMDWGVAVFLCQRLGIENVDRADGIMFERDLHVAFQKRLEEIVDLFNSGLEIIEKKGTRRKIYQRYKLIA
jgi:polar amino acid transport system substrate-binding protein